MAPGQEVEMAGSNQPDETRNTASGAAEVSEIRPEDLARRSRALEAALAQRQAASKSKKEEESKTGSMAGVGQALKLSSEFIAGVGVGVVLGWLLDHFAGTSPWGLIVFLFLGFAAGVLNVLRSVGVVAEAGFNTTNESRNEPDGK